MRKHHRQYRLTPDADSIVRMRAASQANGASPNTPSPTMVLNSIVLRYQALMELNTEKLHPKFTPEELEAIYRWIECQHSSHRSMVMIDRVSQNGTMVKLLQDGAEISGQNVLDTYKRKALLRILTNNLRPHELFTLADNMAIRMSKGNDLEFV